MSADQGRRLLIVTDAATAYGAELLMSEAGVELAGAIGEMSRHTLARDFRNIDPKLTRIILILNQWLTWGLCFMSLSKS